MNLTPYNPDDLIPPRFLRESRDGGVISKNERVVLRGIWRQPSITRSELAARLSLTQQSMHRIVENLEKRDLVYLGKHKSKVGQGKPSPTVLLNPRYACSLGISIHTDKAGITLMDFAGTPSTVILGSEGLSMETTLGKIEHAISRLIEAQGFTRDDLFGIGFGITGYRTQGTQFNAPLPLHEWSLIELGPLLSKRFHAPVWTENSAKTSAICEAMFGVGRHVSSFVYLSFNYGFGGGVIVEGNLLPGGYGNAGEFSGLFDVEEMANRPALEYLLKFLREHGVDLDSVEHLSRTFDPTWPGIETWLDRVTPNYNRLINALWAILDPQAVVFGGQIPRLLAEKLIERTKFYKTPRYGVSRPYAKLIVSDLADDPAATGAAVLPLKHVFF